MGAGSRRHASMTMKLGELPRRHHADVDHRITAADLPWDHEQKASAQSAVETTMKVERTNRLRGRGRARSPARPEMSRPGRSRRDRGWPCCWKRLRSASSALTCGDRANERERNDADRTVDEKVPLPGEVVRDPAAERRSDHWRDDHRDSENANPWPRFSAETSRRESTAHRHHAAAAEPLQDAEKQQRWRFERETAHTELTANSARQIRKNVLRPRRAPESCSLLG